MDEERGEHGRDVSATDPAGHYVLPGHGEDAEDWRSGGGWPPGAGNGAGHAASDDAAAPGRGRPGASQGRRLPRGRRRRPRSLLAELPFLLVIALVLALILKTFVVQAFFIPSGSMEPTVHIGDKVLVSKVTYDLRPIGRGDIVVFDITGLWAPSAPTPTNPVSRLWDAVSSLFGTGLGNTFYIKRVIGIPGDHVACCNARGLITVNGVPLHEQGYIAAGESPGSSQSFSPNRHANMPFSVTVPKGDVWVMGDNRYFSYDSRLHQRAFGHGFVPEANVVGRAFVIVAPFSRWGILSIPRTFEQAKLVAAAPPLGVAAPAAASVEALAALALPVSPAAPWLLGLLGAVPLAWLRRRGAGRLGRARAARRAARR